MNNDNTDDEFDVNEPDFDTDTSDFGEFDSKPERGSLSSALKSNPIIKIGLVAAAIMVVIGAVMLFGGSDEKGPQSVVAGGDELKETPGTKEVSPEMQQVLEDYNQQQLENAVNSGSSVIPQPIEPPKERLPVPTEDTANEDPLARWKKIQEERLQTEQQVQQTVAVQQPTPDQVAADQQKAAEAAALQAAMTNQMSQIISGKKLDNIKSMQVTNLQALMAQRAAAQQQGNLQQNAQNGMQANGANPAANGMTIDPTTGLPISLTPPKVLLPAGAIEYAQLMNEANSDIPGPVVSMIVSGPFAGARVLGNFQRQNEYLVLQFSTLVDKKGNSIPIQAYGMDPDTTLTGMATDVDHRYWERVILPAAAEFVQGMGQAVAEREGTDIAVTGDVVVQSRPPLNTREQVAAGIEEAADRVGEILDQEGQQTQILVRVKAGTPMGILFMSPITDQDQQMARNNPTTATTLNQQRQQQQQLLLQQQLMQSQQQPLYLLPGAAGAAAQNGAFGSATGTSLFGTTNTGQVNTGNTATTTLGTRRSDDDDDNDLFNNRATILSPSTTTLITRD